MQGVEQQEAKCPNGCSLAKNERSIVLIGISYSTMPIGIASRLRERNLVNLINAGSKVDILDIPIAFLARFNSVRQVNSETTGAKIAKPFIQILLQLRLIASNLVNLISSGAIV